MKKKWLLPLLALLVLGVSLPANAESILWYTGGVTSDGLLSQDYVSAITTLANNNPGWDVTFWSGGAMPGPASSYNVLVVASPEGLWNSNSSPVPDYAGLNSAITQGTISFDPSVNNIVLTGQDADFHYLNQVLNTPSQQAGIQGFLQNAIDWAGSGNGMGLVALGQTGLDGFNNGSQSYAPNEPNFGFTGYSVVGDLSLTQTVANTISISDASSAVNAELTSDQLSNWTNSNHYEFDGLNTSLWDGITTDGSGNFATIVSTANGVSGGQSGLTDVPEPAAVTALAGVALLALVGLKRRHYSC